MHLLVLFAIPKSICIHQDRLNRLKQHVLLGLSTVWTCYPKGSHKKGTTKRSIIAYDNVKDRICKE